MSGKVEGVARGRRSSGRRRVLLIIGQLGWGGSEKQMTLLAEGLCRTDHVEVVCTSSSTEPYGPRLEAAGVRLHAPGRGDGSGQTGLISKLRRAWWLVSTLRRIQSDVVLFFSIRNLVALLASCFVGSPIIFTERSLGVWKSRAYLKLDWLLYRRCRLIVANSEATRRFVVEWFPWTGPMTRVVANGIEMAPFVASDIETAERVRFCLVAGLRPWKNHAMLIEACDVLVGEGLDLEVVLVGDGPAREAIEKEIAVRGLEERFTLTGWLSDPLPAISSCHVNMNLSLRESSPNAVLEGMMLGRPSIVTDVGGNTELIEHGVTGLVVPSEDVGALVGSMRSLVENRQVANELGFAARTRAAERFSIETMIGSMDRCIDEVLHQDRSKARENL